MTAELPVGRAARLRALVKIVATISLLAFGSATAAPTADTKRPRIAITSPAGSGTTYPTTEATLSMAGTASDNVGVARVTWRNDRGGQGLAYGTTNWSVSNIAIATGLTTFYVTAYDTSGRRRTASLTVSRSSASPAPAADTSPPAAPTALDASAISGSQIRLGWSAAADNVGVTGYRLERCQGAGCTSFRLIGTTSGTDYSDAGLLSGTSYSYRAQATDAAGNLGAYSNVDSAVTAAPASPPTVSLSASPASIAAGAQATLSWSAANATGCTASGGWSGSKGTSGSQAVGPLNYSTSFTLSCTGTGGSASATTNVLVAAAVTTSAYYVAGAQSNASDGNPGSEAQPWKTIAHAAQAAKAGDTVYIKAGLYAGEVNVANSGEPGKEIIFRAYPGDERRAVIEGGAFNIKSKSYIQVRDLKIQNSPGRGIYVRGPDDWRAPPVRNITLSGNHTYNTYSSGISVWGVSYGLDPGDFEGVTDIVISDNLIEKAVNGGYNECITVAYGVRRADVRDNELRDGGDPARGGEGIDFKDGVKDSFIRNNYIHGLSRRGIYVDGGGATGAVSGNIHIYGNVVVDDPGDAIMVMSEGEGDVDGVYIYNNLVVNSARNGVALYQHPDGLGIGMINDVQIVNNTVLRGGRAGSGWGGISSNMSAATNVVVRNNIALYNNGFDIKYTSHNTTVDHNLCRNSVCESNGDPLFVSPTGDPSTWDYRLKPGSAALDWGSSVGAPSRDMDGVARPQGAAVDLGAYEMVR